MENFSERFNKIVSSSKMSYTKNPYDKRGGMLEFDEDVEVISSFFSRKKVAKLKYSQIRFIIRNKVKNLVLTGRGFKTDDIDKMPKFFFSRSEAREYLIQIYKIDPFKTSDFIIDKVSVSISLNKQKA